ncbi:ubiquitinyl hydrolase 1 [Ranunculus cassubicifolius]
MSNDYSLHNEQSSNPQKKENKRHKPYDDNGITFEMLRKIHLTGEVNQDDIHLLYMTRLKVFISSLVVCAMN